MYLNPKRQQTYEEALKAMSDNTRPMHYLNEISTRHYTEELLETAIRNQRCSLREIPVEKRSIRLCHAVLENCRNEDVQYIPCEFFNYEFSLKAASYCPTELSTILYNFRFERWTDPYTVKDMRIIAEAACPRGRGQWHLDRCSHPECVLGKQTFEEYCSRDFGYAHSTYGGLYKKALDAYIATQTKTQNEGGHNND